MAEENNQEKPISFLDFLRKADIKEVQIPHIQRDYVQGGMDDKTKDIRAGFLDALKRAVTGDSQKVSLDFIYGTNQDGFFLPLDGQQRLTTLFLLHWYGAVTKLEGEERDKIIETLKKFSYQTRLSSRDFCDLLPRREEIISTMADLSADQNPSDVITGDPGYSRFWRYDPTVDSMLNMLDAMHEKFHDVDDATWRGFFESNDRVSFFETPLTNSQSPDDLYVKMNARGKHLTHFENIKAQLQQWMTSMDKDFQKQWKSNMDGEWSFFFWKQEIQRAELSENEKIDPAKRLIDEPFWIFLNRISLFTYFCNHPEVLKVLRNKPGKVQNNDPEKSTFDRGRKFLDTLRLNEENKTDYVSPEYHRDIFGDDNNLEHKKFAYQLISCTLNTLVKLAGNGDELDKLVRPKWPIDKNKATTAAAFFWGRGRSFTWQNLLMIWAFAGYCQKFYANIEDVNRDKLAHWMQFCFQVSDDVDDQYDVANAASMIIMCLDKMRGENEADIYHFLAARYTHYFSDKDVGLKADERLAEWHYRKAYPAEIYHYLFDQKLPPIGEANTEDSEKLLRFNAATILDEALKAYLRCHKEDGAAWEELLSKMEADDRLHGRIQGIISKDDANEQLEKNAIARYEALNNGFSSNSKDFVTLVKFLTTEPSLSFDFSSSASWGQVTKNEDVAEAVCKVLLPPQKEAAEASFEWAKMLNDHPELITGWGNETHRLHVYKEDGMYIFKKGNIASGAIVLRGVVHLGLRQLDNFRDHKDVNISNLPMLDKFSDFYTCKTPGEGGGEFCYVAIKSVPMGAQTEIDGGLKKQSTSEKTVVVDSHNGIWIVGQEDPKVTWDELANYDSVDPEKQAEIIKRLNEIFAQPEATRADKPAEAASSDQA